ncbi:hypothetical protein T440DRAFT_403541 [Plenodomus tracheiphilus IPT5]|uniref:Zn(2)-C6 fungal-type domain-containing protein n=1 Tax=Plenodomus tracheiphilus IPT5 TaxID=1408161 RepID=A0A6A7AYY6_9PLEO|nr:hypothetical protein T440DRAFT_403541 [Plenodomus tracheiphilus IPT5]
MTGNLFPARLRASHQNRRQTTNFRRNGKLQACEPCRKGKLRCDHMMPSCGRCTRKNKADMCVYHPAPLTRTTSASMPRHASLENSPESHGSDTLIRDYPDHETYDATADISEAHARQRTLPQPLPSISRLVEFNSITGSEGTCNLEANNTPIPTVKQPRQSEPEQQQSLPDQGNWEDVHHFDNKAAFINDFAVLAENELSIGIQPPTLNTLPVSHVTQSHIDRGAAVLTLLKDFQGIQSYIDKWFSFNGGFVVLGPMVKLYTGGIWSTWHKILEAQKPAGLKLMSERIWENTLKPLSRLLNRHTTTRGFCASVTGEFLRWEVVGIIVTLVSLLAQSLKDGDPIFCTPEDEPLDRAALALRMLNASEMCVSFCDDFKILNDLYLSLIYENSIAFYTSRTRSSYEINKKTAALSAAAVCCNLHREIKVDEQTPFFIAELRKRLFICGYANDKRVAISAGKPPTLTRHYCQLQVPLDLTDAQMMSEGLDLETAVHDLDEEGWNQRSIIQRCTYARLNATNALIAEEILEITLGHLTQEEIMRRAREIEAKTNKCWADLPSFLRINIEDPWNSKRSRFEVICLAVIRLGHLEHHFLLQRTISKTAGFGPDNPNVNLLPVCDEIFRFVLLMVENKDYFRDYQTDYIQMLAVHGVPTAAVLAVELLHQERNASAVSTIAYPLHRSDTIQRLSVFVSCLGSIRTEAYGSQSCDRGHKFLKKILDTVLGPGPAAPAAVIAPSSYDDLNDPTLGAPLFQPGSDGDFVKWLESMEWDQDIWMNFN